MDEEEARIGAQGVEGLRRFVQVEPELVEFLPAFCDAFSYPGILKVEMKWQDFGRFLKIEITRDDGGFLRIEMMDQTFSNFDPVVIMRETVNEIECMLGISSPCPKCGEPFTDLQVNMVACKVTYAPCGCVSAWDEGAKNAASA